MARATPTEHKPHRFRASRTNHTLCGVCAYTLGKPWHIPDKATPALETTDVAPLETTALIPKKHD